MRLAQAALLLHTTSLPQNASSMNSVTQAETWHSASSRTSAERQTPEAVRAQNLAGVSNSPLSI
jgi:hypothetical protein